MDSVPFDGDTIAALAMGVTLITVLAIIHWLGRLGLKAFTIVLLTLLRLIIGLVLLFLLLWGASMLLKIMENPGFSGHLTWHLIILSPQNPKCHA